MIKNIIFKSMKKLRTLKKINRKENYENIDA
jgi:hypothetical protein